MKDPDPEPDLELDPDQYLRLMDPDPGSGRSNNMRIRIPNTVELHWKVSNRDTHSKLSVPGREGESADEAGGQELCLGGSETM